MNIRNVLGVIVGIALVTTIGTNLIPSLQTAYAFRVEIEDAPVAISGDNVYVTWWTNKTADDSEVMFRASTDGGATFGDKINLSNSSGVISDRAEIDSDADSVVVTWWESNNQNQTTVPVMRVSTDNGATFGPVLLLATNGTIGEAEAAAEEPEEGE